MANWNQNPDWHDISGINNGQVIEAGDGLYAADMVAIIENQQYLLNSTNLSESFFTILK